MLATLRQASHLLGPGHRGRWVLLVFVALVASGMEMLGALLVYVLISLVADPGAEIELPIVGDVNALAGNIEDDTLLLGLIVGMAVFFVLQAAIRVGTAYIQSRIANNTGARLSNRLVRGYLRLPYSAHLHRASSELMRNAIQAVNSVVSEVFVPLIRVIADALMALGLLVVLVAVAPAATGVAVVLIGGTAVFVLWMIQPRLKRLGHTAHEMDRATLGLLQHSLYGIRDLKILGREQYFASRYGRSRLRLARAKYLRATLTEVPHSLIELALIGSILLFFALTVRLGGGSESALSILGLFAYVGLRIRPSVQGIVRGLNNLKYSSAPIEDLHADLLTVETLSEEGEPTETLSFTKAIILEDVSFSYEGSDQNAISQISLTISQGEQLGICGPTGGGKSTLVDLISGLLEPTSGQVTVDGHDLGEHARAWQRNLGMVPQVVFLLDDTLRRNIALGIPDSRIDEDALNEAIRFAQLSEFVASLPRGLDTTVGERGVRISGGERQRLAIARALYRRPKVLIFDEGTSSLDNTTEAELMAAIEQLRDDHTIILVAHRLSTVRNSDRVLFVEQGRITGAGTYEELMSEHASFRMMAGGLIS